MEQRGQGLVCAILIEEEGAHEGFGAGFLDLLDVAVRKDGLAARRVRRHPEQARGLGGFPRFKDRAIAGPLAGVVEGEAVAQSLLLVVSRRLVERSEAGSVLDNEVQDLRGVCCDGHDEGGQQLETIKAELGKQQLRCWEGRVRAWGMCDGGGCGFMYSVGRQQSHPGRLRVSTRGQFLV